MADRLLAWARMIVSILEEAEMWDDVYIAIAAHLTLRELYSTLIERALITEEEARESGIHPGSIEQMIPGPSSRGMRNNVFTLRRTENSRVGSERSVGARTGLRSADGRFIVSGMSRSLGRAPFTNGERER
jgi:hypothetical protein